MIFFNKIKLIAFSILTYSLAIQADLINSSVSNSNNNFGFKIMKESLKDDKDLKNRLLSPFSAHIALSMALNGTNGKTRDSFLKRLGYPVNISNEQINLQNSDLLKELIKSPISNEERERLLATREAVPAVLTINNSAWTTNGFTKPPKYDFNQNFMKVLADYYQVPHVTSLDFVDPKSADMINEWVKNATQGMVPNIIETKQLEGFVWILLNAIYLEAQWTQPFQAINNGSLFYLANNEAINVPFIERNEISRFALSEQANIAELTFNKSSLKAYIILPHTISDFVKLQDDSTGVWTNKFWTKVLKNLDQKNGFIKMPKFSFNDGISLLKDSPLTEALALKFLYEDDADFSKMDNLVPSVLGLIKQNAKIEWDEKGIKAAAATIIAGRPRSAHVEDKIIFDVNRPFYFAIYDELTQTFLFLGQVVDPRK